jgi:hypothetical protein
MGPASDKRMWGDAVLCATYLINRSPTSALRVDKTPAEMFYGKKPTGKYLRVFGCIAYKHIPKQVPKNKFDSKAEKLIMIGYTHNGYILWDDKTDRIIYGRDVVFDENTSFAKMKTICNNNLHTQTPCIIQENTVELEQDYTCDEGRDDGKIVNEEENVRRSNRPRTIPSYLNDYDLSANLTEEHLALNICSYLEDNPKNYEDIKERNDRKNWEEAINDEVVSIVKNNTWNVVSESVNVKPIHAKWVFCMKECESGEIRYKARLVAKGFMQREGLDYNETYAPVARLTTVRAMLAIANKENLYIHQMDVKSAFLQGNIEEEIHMIIPAGFNDEGKICKLNKALYGLKQGPYCWNKRFHTFMLKEKFNHSSYDSCVYYKLEKDKLLYLLVYVDDILIFCKDECIITEAEYISLGEAAKEGVWLLNMLKELHIDINCFTIWEDNQSCISLSKRWEHRRLKHLDVKFNYIKELVAKSIVKIGYIETNDQTADILTKNLTGERFVKHRQGLGLLEVVNPIWIEGKC